MGNSIKVSVLVTFYNQKNYVDRALSSVLDQITDFNIEVIVGDDGSTDGTISIIRNWQQKYPDKIVSVEGERKNKGEIDVFRASHNRLRLLEKARGDYFIILDGDDYFSDREKLKKQVSVLENENNQDCIACGHNIWLEFGDGSRKAFGTKQFPEGKYDAEQYWANMYCHTDSLLIRSSVIPEINTGLLDNMFDDELITFSVLQHGKLYYLPDNMAVYSQTGDGIMTSGNEIINRIRGMMCYDLSNLIAPDLSEVTSKRMAFVWLILFNNRKKIPAEDLQPYLQEAVKKELRCTEQWILYNKMNFVRKIRFLNTTPEPIRKKIRKALIRELRGRK